MGIEICQKKCHKNAHFITLCFTAGPSEKDTFKTYVQVFFTLINFYLQQKVSLDLFRRIVRNIL